MEIPLENTKTFYVKCALPGKVLKSHDSLSADSVEHHMQRALLCIEKNRGRKRET